MNEYKIIKIDELILFDRRDIRPDVINKLKERISAGYNPARPLTVIEKFEGFLVADGNHRLTVLKELGYTEVPCVVRTGNEYSIAIECNNDEETYAPEDLFDRLNTIKQLKEQGLTQSEIGDIIGIGRGSINQYYMLINKIDTNILDLCKVHQKGRVSENDTNVSFNFTEGWFRDSGLYELTDEFQLKLINSFIVDKFNWNKTKVQQTSTKYKMYIDMIELTESDLQDQFKTKEIIEMIKNGVFNTIQQLKKRIVELNENAKNKLICGDCLIELNKIPDKTIDVVLTDPPYGIDYKSNFSKFNNHITKEGLLNDNDDAVELFDKTCEILNKKCKDDAHLYFFIDTKNYPTFRKIAEKYFDVKTPLIWYKSDAGIGDLQYDWINGTEMIIYCMKGYRKLNRRRVNVLQYPRLHSSDMIHPTQKPIELLKEILSVSANKYDIICDPFMGSGSAIKVAKEYGCNYIGIELDRDMFNKAKNNIG
jgi:site-specific DNA-methyltransferase (adenine-specific)